MIAASPTSPSPAPLAAALQAALLSRCVAITLLTADLPPQAQPGELTLSGSDAPRQVANAIVQTHFDPARDTEKLAAAVRAHPGFFGVGIPDSVTLHVKKRDIQITGGSITLLFAFSANRPQRIQTLGPKDKADWIALSRAALDRAGPEYPPKKMPTPFVPKGTLILVGGGGCPEPIVEAFVQAGGGKQRMRLLVIPTAAGGERDDAGRNSIPKFLSSAGLVHPIQLIDPKTRREADQPENLRAIRDATALWFGGGRQWRLVDSFENTQALIEMRQLLDRGGVIAGSSAGATIQGDYLVRGDPRGSQYMIAEGYEKSLSFLPGVGIDQHFAQRKRFADMELLKHAFPQLLGIGLDESTALLVRQSTARVLGTGQVHIYAQHDTSRIDLKSGDSYDLAKRQPLK